MAARKKTENVAEVVETVAEMVETKETAYTLDLAKEEIVKVIVAKTSDMVKGPDRVNDPNIMRAVAELYTAIK